MIMAMNNSVGKTKLNFDDTRDLILAVKVRRIDSVKFSVWGLP